MPNQYSDKSNFIEITKQRIKNTCEINDKGCWIWQGYKCEPKKQYGSTSLAINGSKKKVLAHRASYILFKGEIPKDMQVLHSCDVPLCCNPEHLHLGTPKDNMDEMKERGRERKVSGEKNHKSKIKEEDVKEIRKLHKTGLTHRQLEKLFNIKYNTIHYITSYKTWKHVGD